MGFLDNSGDIILDAVLTDIGRKRLSEGNFRISKFSIGDDEIDYQLFEPDHVSGSAYYDLEILQTPVFEAGTKNISSINYGLYSLNRNDLLYLPVLALNTKITTPAVGLKSGSVFILPANPNSRTAIEASTTLAASKLLANPQKGQSGLNNKILLEAGLNSDASLRGTQANQIQFLLNADLVDSTFNIKFDSRFIESIMSTGTQAATQEIRLEDSTAGVSLITPSLEFINLGYTDDPDLLNYRNSTATGFQNNIYYQDRDTSLDTNNSNISGPRGTALSILPIAKSGIDYATYGKTNQTMFSIGGGVTFRYVDTTVYIMGRNTGINIQLPIRIVEKE